MFALRPNLADALVQATAAECDAQAAWLDRPPPGMHRLHRIIELPEHARLDVCGRALLSWDLHRLAGLDVRADGPARPGGTVVVEAAIGPVRIVAPCRVIDAVIDDGRISFAYATLPGHPEHGVEEFAFISTASGLRFEVRAASAPAFWGSRLIPWPARRMQARYTDRYLAAADHIANRR